MLQRRGRVDRPAADRVGLLVRAHESGCARVAGNGQSSRWLRERYDSSAQRQDRSTTRMSAYSVIMRSAHSTMETKTAGLPNFAPHWLKSASVTPRAREQAPQEKIGICLPTTFSRVSLSGGQPTGMIELT